MEHDAITPNAIPHPAPVVVVGAGLAGLNCARLLARAGLPARVLEASDGVGGRVRTDVTPDGFTLDRGFQVLFPAYPALRRAVDLRALDLQPFDNGAAVVTPRGPLFLRDPLRHPAHAPAALTSPLLSWGDRVRLATLALRLVAARWDGVRDVPELPRSTLDDLRALGFSEGLIERVFRPFLGGILLRRDLSTAGAVSRFLLTMLVRGRAALPARGVQALPEALARSLPAGAVQLRTAVVGLLRADGRVRGVRTADGDIPAGAVVLAADGDATAGLTGLDVPSVAVGSITVYLAGRERPYRQRLLALNALPDPFVNDAALLTNVVPAYAPPGWHLLAAHVLDAEDLDDAVIERRARTDLQRWFPRADLAAWRTLAVVRVPHSQFPQPPGVRDRLPHVRTAWPGLYLAGEITEDSSINGALRSGEAAARRPHRCRPRERVRASMCKLLACSMRSAMLGFDVPDVRSRTGGGGARLGPAGLQHRGRRAADRTAGGDLPGVGAPLRLPGAAAAPGQPAAVLGPRRRRDPLAQAADRGRPGDQPRHPAPARPADRWPDRADPAGRRPAAGGPGRGARAGPDVVRCGEGLGRARRGRGALPGGSRLPGGDRADAGPGRRALAQGGAQRGRRTLRDGVRAAEAVRAARRARDRPRSGPDLHRLRAGRVARGRHPGGVALPRPPRVPRGVRGPSLAAGGLGETLRRRRPDLLCISATWEESADRLQEIVDVVERLPAPRPTLAYGGQAFADPARRAAVRGVYLGPDAASAVATVERLLAETAGPARGDERRLTDS